ncbi:MAG: hypothetical protein JO210_17780 [Acidobacteriaceae bacterium]|nr:hypothetical protein [Acidobacteriaceae bacterium]
MIQPGEDPAEFDELRASLRREHQPANTTEEILVDELAQSFWRMRRFRQLEAHAWQPENLNSSIDSGMMTLIHRSANSAERSFHKTLAALTKLRKCDQAKRTGEPDPGFVPANSSGEATKKTAGKRTCEPAPPEKSVDSAALDRESIVRDQEMPRGFVSQKTAAELEAFEYFGCYPEDMEKYVESLVDSRIGSPDHAENNV